MKSKVLIRLFGRFSVHHGHRELLGRAPCKTKELFGYLALHRGRPHRREALASLLWGENSEERSRKYLRQAIWQLHAGLSRRRSAKASVPLIRVDSGWVQFCQESWVWLDVAEFAVAAAALTGGRPLDPKGVRSLKKAVILYRGELLEGWYQDWCIRERERLRQIQISMLDRLMAHCELTRAHEAGIEYGTISLRSEPARERTHRALMRLHYLSGDRTASLHQYERCVASLREELEVEPEEETQALMRTVKSGRPLGSERPEEGSSSENVEGSRRLLGGTGSRRKSGR